MKLKLSHGGRVYEIDGSAAHDISIPQNFGAAQPSVFGIQKARAMAFEAGGFIGDVRRGGSCNCETYEITPHGNGTHTECVGHITAERIAVADLIKHLLIPCSLITLTPASGNAVNESYTPQIRDDDKIITAEELKQQTAALNKSFLEGLIIRTLPNASDKKTRDYASQPWPYFSLEAMQHIRLLGVQHLLVDFPSVDRADDEGKLACHHIYWELAQGTHSVQEQRPSQATITEMIYIPDELEDGSYFAEIAVPRFESDAAPSRVKLFGII